MFLFTNMPNVQTHCEISLKRTGQEFKELHEWIDETQKYFEENHRIERHTLNDTYLKYIREKWGDKAVVEWLFHIALDNLETANKFSIGVYNKAYDEISIRFKNKEISGCGFTKKYADGSTGTVPYNKETKENEIF